MINIKLRVKNIHFIGIGGSGMSGIAEVLFNLGYTITGSDINTGVITNRLSDLGITIFNSHAKEHVSQADAIVVSSAIDRQNPEYKQAKKRGLPIVPRAEMLAEIMRFRFGIAISGTHGKTTTTSILAHILSTAKLDPTFIIGGILNAEGVGNRLGSGQYIVAEADESDKSFLKLNPMMSVITNIDADHMSTYGFSNDKLQRTFIDFVGRLPFYGLCAVCIENEGVRAILPKLKRSVITYGLSEQADVYASNIRYDESSTSFTVHCIDTSFNITTKLLGQHNVLNILGTICISHELGINPTTIARAMEHFEGVKRRLDFKGVLRIQAKQLRLFDDYAHHPNEIRAVLEGMKNAKGKEPIIIFQPHRYSRTIELFDEFISALQPISKLIIMPVYAAGEIPDTTINATTLLTHIGHGHLAQDITEIVRLLDTIAEDDDIVMTLGAGNITHIAQTLAQEYGS